MREIKFRAWDKKSLIMRFFDGIFNDRPYTETSLLAQYESHPEYHELEIMQFTGLLDSKDFEIYEGDIVEYSFRRLTAQKTVESDTSLGGWHPFSYNGGGDWHPSEVEVIGNIHEQKDCK